MKRNSNLKIPPNLIIISASLIVSLLFFWVARCVEGIWYDFTINISASMLIIGITVILVDLLRESHKKRLFHNSKSTALNKLVGSNTWLVLSLAVYNRKANKQIIEDLIKEDVLVNESHNLLTKKSQEL